MKHKHLTAVVCTLLCCLLCLPLVGCSRTAFAYEGDVLSEGQYRYLLSYYKYAFLNQYGGTDTDAFFNKETRLGNTYAEFLSTKAQENIRAVLVGASLFDSYQLSFTDSDEAEIDNYIKEKKNDFGSSEKFDEIINQLGVSEGELRDVMVLLSKAQKTFDYLYGDTSSGVSGAVTIADEDMDAFYKAHYYAFTVIWLRTVDYITDPDGKVVTDNDGNVQTKPASAATQAQKREECSTVESALKNGEDFAALQKEHNQDTDAENYPDGYLLSDFNSGFSSEVTDAVMSLGENEWTMVEDAYGYEFIKRLPLPDAAYSDSQYSGMMSGFTDMLNSAEYASRISSLRENVRENTAVTEKYSLRDADITFFTFFNVG